MRAILCGFIVVGTLAVGLLALPAMSAGEDAAQKTNLDELLKQRRDTLQQVVEVVAEEYHIGKTSFTAVVQAKARLIEAELEMAKDRQERLGLLRQQVEMFEKLSAVIDERFALGQVTHAERLAAQVALLDAKIELAREEHRAGETSD